MPYPLPASQGLAPLPPGATAIGIVLELDRVIAQLILPLGLISLIIGNPRKTVSGSPGWGRWGDRPRPAFAFCAAHHFPKNPQYGTRLTA
jgi:hypothetical protein